MRENRTYGSERGSELPYLGAHPYLYGILFPNHQRMYREWIPDTPRGHFALAGWAAGAAARSITDS